MADEKVPVPSVIAQRIANDAVRRAKAYGSRRRWTATRRLRPLWAKGVIGIRDPLKFLVYQDRGTPPRVMRELEGKTIPITNKRTGETHFVKAVGVGQPGWTRLPNGVRVWKDQKWKSQGVKPTRFMQKAIEEAVEGNRSMIKDRLQTIVRAGSNDHSLRS